MHLSALLFLKARYCNLPVYMAVVSSRARVESPCPNVMFFSCCECVSERGCAGKNKDDLRASECALECAVLLC